MFYLSCRFQVLIKVDFIAKELRHVYFLLSLKCVFVHLLGIFMFSAEVVHAHRWEERCKQVGISFKWSSIKQIVGVFGGNGVLDSALTIDVSQQEMRGFCQQGQSKYHVNCFASTENDWKIQCKHIWINTAVDAFKVALHVYCKCSYRGNASWVGLSWILQHK